MSSASLFLHSILLMTSASLFATEIIAHRGASYDFPENTCAAAARAWKDGADAVELDVHQTKDDQLVVVHDADTRRTTGAAGLIANLSLAEVQALDAGTWKGAKFAGEKIPTLEQFLSIGPANRRFFIEVKCGPKAIPELKAVLERAKLPADQTVIISFNKDVVATTKKELPALKSILIVGYGKDAETGRRPTLDELTAEAKLLKLDGLDLSYKWPIDAAFVQKAKAAGLSVWVWTVDNADVARQMKAAGVDGITTNRPAWLRAQL